MHLMYSTHIDNRISVHTYFNGGQAFFSLPTSVHDHLLLAILLNSCLSQSRSHMYQFSLVQQRAMYVNQALSHLRHYHAVKCHQIRIEYGQYHVSSFRCRGYYRFDCLCPQQLFKGGYTIRGWPQIILRAISRLRYIIEYYYI